MQIINQKNGLSSHDKNRGYSRPKILIKFRMVSHLNMGTHHVCAYESIDHEPKIGMCVHTHIKEDGTFGREYRHYRFNGKTYKTKKKFLEAMTKFEEERKSKFEKL